MVWERVNIFHTDFKWLSQRNIDRLDINLIAKNIPID